MNIRILLSLLFLLSLSYKTYAQGTDCANAINISANNCTGANSYDNTGIAGTINPGCFGGGTNNSMWFKFVATSFVINITMNGGSLASPMVAIMEDPGADCAGVFTELGCSIAGTINFSALNVGEVYYLIVDGGNNSVGTFELCLSSPTQPVNDDICNAISLPTNFFCSGTDAYTTAGATPDLQSGGSTITPACFTNSSSLINGVWFKFTATGSFNTIDINGGNLAQPQVTVIDITDNNCGNIVSGNVNFNSCSQVTTGASTSLQTNNLVVGNEYYILVDGMNDGDGSFEICINSYTQTGAMINDECVDAIFLCPSINYDVTTNGATPSSSNAPSESGFNNDWSCNGVVDNVVWFDFLTTTPAQDINFTINSVCSSGKLQFEVFEHTGGGSPCADNNDWNSKGCVDFSGNSSTLNIAGGSLSPNTQYYLIVDNFPNANCDFNFVITGNQGATAGANQNVCADAPAFTLPGFSPTGGTWSGPGVTTAGVFTPTAAGIGMHTLYYTYGNCTDSKIITITGPVVSIQNGIEICDGICVDIVADAYQETALVSNIPFSNTTNANITSNNPTTNSIITTSGLTSAILTSICINLTHTYMADLDMYLICPDGTRLELSTDNGGASNDFTGCFTITAATPVGGGTGPFVGTFIPEGGSLSTFNGCTPNGNWTLEITDDSGGDSGTLLDWDMTFENSTYNIDPPTNFSWSPTTNLTNTNTFSPNFCAAGAGVQNYTLTATDAAGCTNSKSIAITVTDNVVVTPTATPESCDGACDGEVNLALAGGSTPYSFLWDNGATSQNITGLCDATYAVTVTDGTGCEQVVTSTVTPGPNVTANFAAVTNQCLIGNSFSFDGSTSTGATTYSWDFDDGTALGTGATPTHSYATDGTYNVTLTIGAGACTDDSVMVVEVYPSPNVTLTPTNITCNGLNNGQIVATAADGNGVYTYTWAGAGGFIGTAPNGGASDTEGNLIAGTYTITVVDGNSCNVTATADITEPNPIVITITANDVSCFGNTDGNVTALATGGATPFTYQWGANTGFQTTPSISGLGAGTYNVTATDASSCTITDSGIITEPASMTLTTSSNDASCGNNDGDVTVAVTGGTGPYTYNWTGGGSGATVNSLGAGAYSVTVTDNSTCTSISATNVLDGGAPTLTIINITSITCNGDNDGSAEADVTGGIPAYNYLWDNGQTDAIAINLAGGNHTVTITDSNTPACVSTETISISEPPALIINILSSTNPTCGGASDGIANAAASGGLSPYSYLWNNSENTASASALIAGIATVTVTDVSQCTAITSITLTEPTPITITPVVVAATCSGNSDGSIDITIGGGTSPYTFSWSNGATSEDLATVPVGAFTVVVTDANFCTNTITTTITQPAPLSITLNCTDVTTMNASNGTSTAVVTGGTSAYTYIWDNAGETTVGVTGLSATTIAVTATDVNSCTITTNCIINEPNCTMILTSTVTDALCLGATNGSVSIDVTGATTPLTYVWSNGGTTTNITGVSSGDYVVTVIDGTSCVQATTVTVGESAGITLTTVPTNIGCSGAVTGAITANAVGAVPPLTYAWSNSSAGQSITGLAAGTYDVTVSDVNLCQAIVGTTITEGPPFNSTVSSVSVSCNGGTDGGATIMVSGGTGPYQYFWGNFETTATVVGLSVDTLDVTVTDANFCIVEDSVRVIGPAQITATSSNTLSSCGQSDGSATIDNVANGIGTITYLWSDPNSSTGATVPNLPSGSYNVTITDGNGCAIVETVLINDNAGPVVSITTTANVLCSGGSDGAINISVTGGQTPYIYLWSENGITTQNISGLTAGNYSVTVGDPSGCQVIGNTSVSEPIPLGLNFGPSTMPSCYGYSDGATIVTPTGGTAPYSYLWSNGGVNATISGIPAGIYTVTLTDANICSITASTTLTDPQLFVVNTVATDVSCSGFSDGIVSATIGGGASPFTYLWSDGAIAQDLTNIGANTYTITVTDASLCEATSTATVGEPAGVTATISFSSDLNCSTDCDGTATVQGVGGSGVYTYSWSPTAQTNPTATGLCEGIYTATVFDDNNCPSSITVSIASPSAMTLTLNPTSPSCVGTNDGSIISTLTGGTTPYAYIWINTQTTTTITGLADGSFNLSVADANGCSITETATLVNPTELILSSSSTLSACGQANGAATVNVTQGLPAYTYLWDANANNQATAMATGIPAGNYSVSVSDGNGCEKILAVGISDAGAPTVVVLTQSDVTCNGGSDGFAQVAISGGTTPFTYAWSNGATAISTSGLSEGIWIANVTDGVGCIAAVNVNIGEPTLVSAIMSNTQDVTCFGGTDGTATALGTGGVTPYTYLWSNNQGTPTATGLSPTSYVVAVTDFNNCPANISVTINEPPQIVLSTTVTDANCGAPTGGIQVGITNGVAPLIFNWSNSQNANPAVSLVAGNYTVTVTDNTGCSETTVATVGNLAGGTATIAGVQEVSCYGGNDGEATVSMSGGVTPYTYLWDVNTGLQTTVTATGLAAQVYDVSVTDGTNCMVVAVVTIGEPNQLAANISVTEEACFNTCDGTATVVNTGGTGVVSFLWDDPISQISKTATGLCAGDYNVTITDQNLCGFITSVTINPPPAIQTDSTVTNSNCQQSDGNACVSASGGTGGFAYLWGDGSTGSCLTNIAAGSYNITVFDANNCEESNVVVVTDAGSPTVSITATDVLCNGGITGSATVVATGGVNTFSYEWKDAASNVIQNTPVASNLGQGLYSVEVTDDTTGCIATTSIMVNEPSALSYTPSSTTPSCYGGTDGTASVIMGGGVSPYTYQWNTVPNQTTPTAVGLSADIYTVDVLDANNCSQTFSYTLTNPTQIIVTITATDVLCFDECNGTAMANVSNASGNISYEWNNGQVSQTALNLCDGTYSVTVTDDNGCKSQESVIIDEPTVLNLVVNNSGDVVCYGGNDGYVQVTASGGVIPYTYNWTNNVSSTPTATGLPADNYTINITDGNGCTQSISENVTQPIELSIGIIASTDVSCFDACDGSATTSVSGGVAPFIYQWDVNGNFLQTPTANNLCANSGIVVSVTDANGCSASTTVDIAQPTELIVSTSVTDAHCGFSDGTIQTQISGGTGPFTYNWGAGGIAPVASPNNVPAGCYTLNILDANFCNYIEVICLNDISGPTVSLINYTDVTCFGESTGAVNANVTGGTTPYQSIEWINQSGTSVSTGAVGISFVPGGTTYFIEVEDAAGCIGTLAQYIEQPTSVISTIIDQVNVSCFGGNNGTATVVAGGGTYPYVYLWNNGQLSPYATGLSVGIYTAVVADANGCQDPSQAYVTITEPQPLAPISTIEDVSCNGGNDGAVTFATTGGTGAYYFYWNPNQGVANGFINNLTAGTYSVTIADQNGCEVSTSATVDEPNPLVATISSEDSYCSDFNGVATISGVSGGRPGYTYSWSNSNNTAASYTGLYAGTYTGNVTDTNGCVLPLTITVLDQAGPTITSILFEEPSCFGDCDGAASVQYVGGANPVLPLWSDANSQNTYTATNLCSGYYCVTLTDANGCVAIDCKLVTEPTPFEGNGGANQYVLCDGESTQIWGSPSGGNWPYPSDNTKIEWDDPTLNYEYGPHNVTPQSGIITTYNFTVTDGKGCTASDKIEVEVYEPLSLFSIPDTNQICIGDSADVCFQASGGNPSNNYIFDWLYDSHIDSAIALSCHALAPTADTWYYVILNDGCSTPATDSSLVMVHPQPPLQFSAPILSGCPPLEVAFSGVTGIDFPNATFTWDFQADSIPDDSLSQFPVWTYEESGVYSVFLEVRSQYGCVSDTTIESYITVYPTPIANFVMRPDSTLLTNPLVKVNGTLTIGADSLNWQFEDPYNPYETGGLTAQHLYSDTGVYNIILTAMNEYGCLDVDTQIFKVLPGHSIYAPSAFTPNDDGKNDGFRLKGVGVVEFELAIFDRWGEQVFVSDNIFKEWDGKSKGGKDLSPNDVYIWKANVLFMGQTVFREFIGTVTLVK